MNNVKSIKTQRVFLSILTVFLSLAVLSLYAFVPSMASGSNKAYASTAATFSSTAKTAIAPTAKAAIASAAKDAAAVDKTAAPAPSGLMAQKASATSLKLTWKKATGVSGYAVYQKGPKETKYKRIKTLAGAGRTALTVKKLKTNRVYWFKIRAYKSVNGQNRNGAYSYTVSATPFSKDAKKANVTGFKGVYTSRCLGLKAVHKVKVKLALPKGKKAASKALAWSSSDKSIVKASKGGWITAQGKPGKAKVYIRAHDGMTKTLNVSVADYANPARFYNIALVRKHNERAADILTNYKSDLCGIASALDSHRTDLSYYYENNELGFLGKEAKLGPAKDMIINLIKNEKVTVGVDYGGMVGFGVFPYDNDLFSSDIIYTDFNGKDNKAKGSIKIAPCWYYNTPEAGL